MIKYVFMGSRSPAWGIIHVYILYARLKQRMDIQTPKLTEHIYTYVARSLFNLKWIGAALFQLSCVILLIWKTQKHGRMYEHCIHMDEWTDSHPNLQNSTKLMCQVPIKFEMKKCCFLVIMGNSISMEYTDIWTHICILHMDGQTDTKIDGTYID